MEQLVEYGGKTLFDWVNAVMDSLGNRPFMESRMTERQQLEAYQALRNSVDGLYYYADGIRMELDSRLAQYSAEERIALGLSDEELRRIAYLLTLKYDKDMKRISAKLGIPIEGLELVPEPLPPVEEPLGGEEWLENPEIAPLDILPVDSTLSGPIPITPMAVAAAPLPSPQESPLLPPLQ
jgi:hypothetical protein